MRKGRCMSLIERLKMASELKSTLSAGKLFQRFINVKYVGKIKKTLKVEFPS